MSAIAERTDLEIQELSPTAQSNIERLEQAGEIGVFFADLYKTALGIAPELAEVIIHPTDKQKVPWLAHTGGSARHQGYGNGVQPELLINTGDGWEHFRMLMKERPVSTKVSAEKAGIPLEELTPRDLAAFIFLHELGHALYYLSEVPNLEEMKRLRKEELDTLTWPGWNPAKMKTYLESADGIAFWNDNVMEYKKHGIFTPSELLYLQEAGYHSLSTEDYPDKFAARVLQLMESELAK